MVYMGELGLGQNWHHFKHKRVHRRSAVPISDHLSRRLSDHHQILDYEQQRARKRVKRDFVESFRFRDFFLRVFEFFKRAEICLTGGLIEFLHSFKAYLYATFILS